MRDNRQLDLLSWRPSCEIVMFPHGRLLGRARDLVALRSRTSDRAMSFIWKGEVEALDRAMAALGISIVERDRQLEAFARLVRTCSAAVEPEWGHSEGDAA